MDLCKKVIYLCNKIKAGDNRVKAVKVTMLTLHRLDLENVKEIMSSLDKKFGLVFVNDLNAHGNTISVSAKVDEDMSKNYTKNRFIVNINSSYFSYYTLLSAIEGYNDDFFLKH